MQPSVKKIDLNLEPGFVLRSAYARPGEGLVAVVDNYPVSTRRWKEGNQLETKILYLDGQFRVEKSHSINQFFHSAQVQVGAGGHAAVVLGFNEKSNAFERPNRTVRSEHVYVFNASGDLVTKLPIVIAGDGVDISRAPYVSRRGEVWIKTQTDSSSAAGSRNYNKNAPLERWTPGTPSEGPGRDILLTRISAVTGEHRSYRVGTDGMDLSSGGRLIDDEQVFLLHGKSESNKPILVDGGQARFSNTPASGNDAYFIPFTPAGAGEGFYRDPRDPQTYVNSVPTNHLFRDQVTGDSYYLERRIDTSSISHGEAIGSFYVPKAGAFEAASLDQISSSSVDRVYQLADDFYSSTPHRFKLYGTQFELEGSGGLSANTYGNYFVVGDLKSVSGSDLMTGADLLAINFSNKIVNTNQVSNWTGLGQTFELTLKAPIGKVNTYAQYQAPQQGGEVNVAQVDWSKGGAQGAVVNGSEKSDRLYAKVGWDRIEAGDGNDMVRAGNGRDVITGGKGADELHGDFGWNTYTSEKDGFRDLIVVKSDNNLVNHLYNKAGNNPDGRKADIIEGLDPFDSVRILGAETSSLHFQNASAHGVEGIGIFAGGALEALYVGGDLSLDQLKEMTSGDPAASPTSADGLAGTYGWTS